jgi:gamma-glutamyltranspeptidase/glutathione hydrolase
VACGHPLGSAAALEVFLQGGNAVDAAVAAAAVLAVVLPDACGIGGDTLALVRPGGGGPSVAYNGWGAAPQAVPARIPLDGGGTVSPPGAVRAWGDMLAGSGTRELGALLERAIRMAEDGVAVGAPLLASRDAQRTRLERTAASFGLLDPALRPGSRWRQPELARSLRAVAERGPGRAVLRRAGGGDRRGGAGRRWKPRRRRPRGPPHAGPPARRRPPRRRGAARAAAAEPGPAGADGPARRRGGGSRLLRPAAHLAVEAIEAAFAHRDDVAADGAEDRLLALDLELDPDRAGRRGGPRGYTHTTTVGTADAEGTVVSMLVDGVRRLRLGRARPGGRVPADEPPHGVQRRSRVPERAGAGRRPVHTLSPALVEHGGLAFALATPGADGQVQTLLQVVDAVVQDGLDLPSALARPRWRSRDGMLEVEDDLPADVRRLLESRGHLLEPHPAGDGRFGAAVAVGADTAAGTLFAVADGRREVHAAAL